MMGSRFHSAGTVSTEVDRRFAGPLGVDGGRPGARARTILGKAGGTAPILPKAPGSLGVEEGDRLHFTDLGAGGWGNLLERDPALAARKLCEGPVGPQCAHPQAARPHGEVCDAEGRPDGAATRALPAATRVPAPPTALFDPRRTVLALRACRLAGAGLPAPVQPVRPFLLAAD